MNKQVSAGLVGLEVFQDEQGHWSVYREERRISGPLFNRPEIRKKVTKGEVLTVIRHNPGSDNPIDFLA